MFNTLFFILAGIGFAIAAFMYGRRAFYGEEVDRGNMCFAALGSICFALWSGSAALFFANGLPTDVFTHFLFLFLVIGFAAYAVHLYRLYHSRQ